MLGREDVGAREQDLGGQPGRKRREIGYRAQAVGQEFVRHRRPHQQFERVAIDSRRARKIRAARPRGFDLALGLAEIEVRGGGEGLPATGSGPIQLQDGSTG